jgi:hypothetical protein
MSLVTTTEQIQDYIAVSSNFDFDRVKPYIAKAERKYIVPLIGKTEYEYFIDGEIDTETESEGKKIVRKLLEEATTNLAFHLGFATLFVHISNTGVTNDQTDNAKQSDWHHKVDLHRSFIRDGNEALDEALKEMEFYLDDFQDWSDSSSFTILNESFNKHTDDFQKWFNIHNSRQTFLALKPTIREVSEQYFFPWLDSDTITQIKSSSSDQVVKRALELAQKAEVALTVAKIAKTGTFQVTDTGFFLRWEALPHEKAYKDVDSKKLNMLCDSKQTAGEEYLKKLKTHIEANPDTFSDYTVPTSTTQNSIIKKKSGLAI